MTQDDNSAALAHQQQSEYMQILLTKEKLYEWYFNVPVHLLNLFNKDGKFSIKNLYLKEHGLPLDSIIEGL